METRRYCLVCREVALFLNAYRRGIPKEATVRQTKETCPCGHVSFVYF